MRQRTVQSGFIIQHPSSKGDFLMNETPEMPVQPSSEEPKKNNQTMIIAVVVVVLLCCCCIVLAGGWFYGDSIMSAIGQ